MNDPNNDAVPHVPTLTRNIHKYYRMIAEVGSGTYGRVYKAECLRTKEYVALKKFESKDEKVKEDGFPITAVREIRLLKQLNHINVIKLREIIVSKPQEHNDFRGSTFLVFDYMDHDFAGLHRNKHEFSLQELKCIMLQILKGVQYLHSKRVIHRDLKIANILYSNDGYVKIADFGLARMLNPNNPKYTNKVVTLWYRAPEILLGAKEYTQQVDLWSVGCIFIELAVRENLLRGENEPRQLEKIYDLCGGINSTSWPEAEKLSNWKDLKPKRTQVERKLQDVLIEKKKNIDPELLDLLDKLMVLNPKKRYNVQQCLDHPFFHSDPLPLQPSEMSKIKEECHEALLKNIQSRNQVIASHKSNFQSRGHQSPSRILPQDRLQKSQSQTIGGQQQLSKSQSYPSAQNPQYVGAGHFDSRGGRHSNSSSQINGLGYRANSSSQSGQQQQNSGQNNNRHRHNNNNSSSNNYQKKNHDDYEPSNKSGESKMSSLAGLASLVSNQLQQSTSNNHDGLDASSMSGMGLSSIVRHSQQHTNRNTEGGATDTHEQSEDMLASQLRRSASAYPLAMLALGQTVSQFNHDNSLAGLAEEVEQSLNQKRHLSPQDDDDDESPVLKKKPKGNE